MGWWGWRVSLTSEKRYIGQIKSHKLNRRVNEMSTHCLVFLSTFPRGGNVNVGEWVRKMVGSIDRESDSD